MRDYPKCDGSGPHHPGDVRVLTFPNGNLILCAYCLNREVAWRRERNADLSADARYDLPTWSDLEVYAP